MGSSSSKPTTENNALLLCKERMKFIKQAIDSRDALSAAHLTYLHSLCSLGTSLRRFVETELLVESSISTSEVDKSPWHSSYASPSPSGFPEHVGSPSLSGSPLSPRLSNISYMRTTGSNAMTVAIDSSTTHYVEDDTLTFPRPPPPPPEIDSSWDFFDPTDMTANADGGQNMNFSRVTCLRHLKEAEVVPLIEEEHTVSDKEKESKGNIMDPDESSSIQKKSCDARGMKPGTPRVNESLETMVRIASSELCGPKEQNDKLKKELCAEREDASEFITHRAKDLLSSMREIEHRFNRAAEAGKEVSRMLETNKIRLGTCTELIGNPPASRVLLALNRICCKGNHPSAKPEDSDQNVKKYITWKRSVSSLSSSSKLPLTSTAKDYAGDSSSDFMEEFSMISGSHSSTLDRLYAWERKLYDEIKASEYIRKVYDQKCSHLRHQFAKDVKASLIDKTRAVVKDLHSRVRVAIQSVDSISRRIEKLRDDELLPQLVELIQGLIRMWKAMLECHHAQFITISLAYLVKNSSSAAEGEPYKKALVHLMNEMDCFNQSFSSWTSAHKTYVQTLDSWLQQCILQPQARRKGRKTTFPPRHALPPPIFVLCGVWLDGLKSLPSGELCDSITSISSVLHDTFDRLTEEKQVEKVPKATEADKQPEKVAEEESKEDQSSKYSNLDSLRAGLTKLFDRLTKFSEASLKVHEDVKQGNEMARMAYTNAGTR